VAIVVVDRASNYNIPPQDRCGCEAILYRLDRLGLCKTTKTRWDKSGKSASVWPEQQLFLFLKRTLHVAIHTNQSYKVQEICWS
jgi:hypothetical protein